MVEKKINGKIELVPDIFELDEWMLENHPDVLKALHYCAVGTQYDSYYELWEKAGKPLMEHW